MHTWKHASELHENSQEKKTKKQMQQVTGVDDNEGAEPGCSKKIQEGDLTPGFCVKESPLLFCLSLQK